MVRRAHPPLVQKLGVAFLDAALASIGRHRSAVAAIVEISPENPFFTSSGRFPLWSMRAARKHQRDDFAGGKRNMRIAFPRPHAVCPDTPQSSRYFRPATSTWRMEPVTTGALERNFHRASMTQRGIG